jgi:hypothetical protein
MTVKAFLSAVSSGDTRLTTAKAVEAPFCSLSTGSKTETESPAGESFCFLWTAGTPGDRGEENFPFRLLTE